MHQEKQYLDRLSSLIKIDNARDNRTDTDTVGFFGGRMEYDLSAGEFPLMTTKKLNIHYIMAELDWFLSGSNNAHQLIKRSCPIWNEWMKPLNNYSDGVRHGDRPLVLIDTDKLNLGSDKVVIPGLRSQLALNSDEIVSAYAAHRFTATDVVAPEWLKDLWIKLLNQSYFNVYPSMFTGNQAMVDLCIRGLVTKWFDFPTFLKDIKKVDNYSLAELTHIRAKEYTGNLKHALTGLYSGSSVLGPKTAIFLHKQEYKEYLHQEQFGVLKVHFKDAAYGKVTPMLLMREDDVNFRIDKSLIVDRVERVLISKKLRYAKSYGDLGPIYGVQWRGRSKEYIDQIADAIYKLKHTPHDRRIIVNSWNVSQLKDMALPPCHLMFQFYMEKIDPTDIPEHISKVIGKDVPKYKLSVQVYLRSQDVFLGEPYNTASYAALLIKMAGVVNAVPGKLILVSGDTHLYVNHLKQVKEQVTRKPHPLPKFTVSGWGSKDPRDVAVGITDYVAHPHISGDVAV